MDNFENALPGKTIHNPSVPTHFMWLQPVKRQISVYHENMVLAVTTDALRVIEVGHDVYEPMLYVPMRDLCVDLKANENTTHCPLKGETCYFDLVDTEGNMIVADAAWSYHKPLEIAAALKGRVGFDLAQFTVESAPL